MLRIKEVFNRGFEGVLDTYRSRYLKGFLLGGMFFFFGINFVLGFWRVLGVGVFFRKGLIGSWLGGYFGFKYGFCYLLCG